MKHKFLYAIMALIGLVGQSALAASWDTDAQKAQAADFTKGLVQSSRNVISRGGSEAHVIRSLCGLLEQATDMDYIAKSITLDQWVKASAPAKQEFKKTFGKVLATLFKENFETRKASTYRLDRVRAWSTEPGFDVFTALNAPSGRDTTLVFNVRLSNSQLLIRNMIVSTIDLRQYFRKKYYDDFLKKIPPGSTSRRTLVDLTNHLQKEYVGKCP